MSGSGTSFSTQEAVSALRWWLESGVNAAVQESPRNWLEREIEPAVTVARPDTAPAPEMDTLEAFREWLSTSPDAPLAAPRSRAVLPSGYQGAEIMLLSEPPTHEETASGEPIAGESAQLMERMLAAIGLAGQAYSANLACFHSPGARLSQQQLEQCSDTARRHVALAQPKRLLLLGDAPCLALLGKRLVEARGHVHKVEGVRTIATFHPRQLLKRASDKALAWKDLLLLMEETP